MATKSKTSTKGYVTGTLHGQKQTFTSAEVAKQYGATVDGGKSATRSARDTSQNSGSISFADGSSMSADNQITRGGSTYTNSLGTPTQDAWTAIGGTGGTEGYQAQTGGTPSAAAIAPPTVPVNVPPAPTLTSDLFAAPTKTAFDVNSLIAENRKLQQQYLAAFTQPDKGIEGLQQKIYDNENQQRNTQLNAQAGMNKIEAQPVAMDAIIGQQANVQRQANTQLQTLAFQQQPLVQQMEILSKNKTQMLKAYEMALSFGKDDIQLAMQLQAITKQEQNAAKEFAMEYGVQKPFYTVDGQTIYRTSDGKAYSTLQEWQADGGKPELIQTVTGDSGEAATDDIAEYEYAVSTGYQGSFADFIGEGGPSGRAPRSGRTPRSTSDFSSTQLSKGAAAAGMSISEFAELDEDTQNYYIQGQGKNLEAGYMTDKDFEEFENRIDDMADEGYTSDEIVQWLLEQGIPAEDRYELEEYAQESAQESGPRGGIFDSGLWSSSQGDKWYNPLGWFK